MFHQQRLQPRDLAAFFLFFGAPWRQQRGDSKNPDRRGVTVGVLTVVKNGGFGQEWGGLAVGRHPVSAPVGLPTEARLPIDDDDHDHRHMHHLPPTHDLIVPCKRQRSQPR